MKLRLGSALVALFLTQSVSAAYYAFRTDYPAAYDVAGFDWLSRLEVFRIFDGPGKSHTFEKAGRKYAVVWRSAEHRIAILEEGRSTVEFALLPLLEKLRAHPASAVVPQPQLTLEVAQPPYRARLLLEDLSVEWEKGVVLLHHFKADVLFHRTR